MTRKPNRYESIKQRLDDWGNYRRHIAPGVGWNVHMLDFDADVPRGIQKRNDVYSDPVFSECQRMLYEQRRAMTTDTAVRELRPRWLRRLIIGRHKRWPEISDSHLAAKLGLERRLVTIYLSVAYEALLEGIEGLDYQRHNAA